MLVPAIARIAARFAKLPRAVTADRGYGEVGVDADLEALGVKKVVIPPARASRAWLAERCRPVAGFASS
jgi:IS5 family transposase